MRKYTDEDFKEAVKSSFSISEVLKKIGLKPTGGNYKLANNRIVKLNLDMTHFTGKGHLKGKTHEWSKKIPLETIMVEDYCYGSHKLKKRLLKEKQFERKCYNCNNTEWLGNPIPIELEHKNGNNRDNRKENLTLLCPNCHALTPTYRGKNKHQ